MVRAVCIERAKHIRKVMCQCMHTAFSVCVCVCVCVCSNVSSFLVCSMLRTSSTYFKQLSLPWQRMSNGSAVTSRTQ